MRLLNTNDRVCAPRPTKCVELILLSSNGSTNIIEADPKPTQSLKGKKKFLINDKFDDVSDEDYVLSVEPLQQTQKIS